MSDIQTEHMGIRIVYSEFRNRWEFELRGKERFAISLASAKKAIETQPKEKVDFEPQKAIFSTGYRGETVVTVTSVAVNEDRFSSRVQYWIVDKRGMRSKVSSEQLFAHGPSNMELAIAAKKLDKKAEMLRVQAKAKRAEMAPFTPKITGAQ